LTWRLMLAILLAFALSGPSRTAAQTLEENGPSLATAEAPEETAPSLATPQTPEAMVEIIQAQADMFGVNGAPLVRLGQCESSLRPWATGDRGTSHGLFQINGLATGLLPHFLAAGYSDPYEPWQAAAYVARVAAGEWAAAGITLARWSCWRR
jgi:hypothetical protein